jgi:1,4-dihydroxy-2-naphthoate polyprenyltransferase
MVQVVRAANFISFVRMTRPVFLLGGILLYLLGAAAAAADGAVLSLSRLVIGQVLVTAIQLMTQYSNEYYDIACDRLNDARTWFSGGSGVLVSGDLSAETARKAMLVFAWFGLLMVVLAGLQVPLMFIIGLVSLAAAWSYSGPPFALVSSGYGELIASLVVALAVPIVGYVMQSGGSISLSLLLIVLPLVLIHFAMLVAFQIPDRYADQAVGKRTLTVRYGLKTAVLLHNLALAAAFTLMLLAWGRWPGAQLAWLALPVALWQAFRIRQYLFVHPDRLPARYFWLTMRAVGLLALTTALWLAGFAFHFL